MRMDFGSVMTAMVTPFTKENEVNYEKACQLADHLLDNGSDSLVVLGTTGESPTLNLTEKLELCRCVRDAVGEKGKIIVGTGCNCTQDTIEITREVEKIGADAVMAVVPYYNRPTQEGLYLHFKSIAENTDLPVVLYNVPGRTSANLEPETVERLVLENENIQILKEASGSPAQMTEVKKRVGDALDIYSGDDALTLPFLALGAKGIISVAAHLVGKEIQEMIASFKAGDWEESLKMHLELTDIFKSMFLSTNPIPVKTALNIMGWELGGMRLPLNEADDILKEELTVVLKQYKLI